MEGIRALTVFVGAFEKWIVDFFLSAYRVGGVEILSAS